LNRLRDCLELALRQSLREEFTPPPAAHPAQDGLLDTGVLPVALWAELVIERRRPPLDSRDDGLHTGVIILIQAFACTSETLAGFQSTFPKTLGRSLVSGFLPADALDASRSDVLKKPQEKEPGNPTVCHNAVGKGGHHPRRSSGPPRGGGPRRGSDPQRFPAPRFGAAHLRHLRHLRMNARPPSLPPSSRSADPWQLSRSRPPPAGRQPARSFPAGRRRGQTISAKAAGGRCRDCRAFGSR